MGSRIQSGLWCALSSFNNQGLKESKGVSVGNYLAQSQIDDHQLNYRHGAPPTFAGKRIATNSALLFVPSHMGDGTSGRSLLSGSRGNSEQEQGEAPKDQQARMSWGLCASTNYLPGERIAG